MPKPFTISIDVEEMMLGTVMRRLNTMEGVISIDFDFDAPRGKLASEMNGSKPPKPRPTGPRQELPGGGTMQDFILRLLAKNGPMAYSQLSAALAQVGRSGGSASSQTWKLKQQGEIHQSADGLYSINAKGRERLKTSSNGKAAPAEYHRHEVPQSTMVLQLLADKPLTQIELAEVFEKDGRARTSARSCVNRLREKGLVKRGADDKNSLTAKGEAELKQQTAAE